MPSLQLNVYAGVPPLISTVIPPVVAPLQSTFVATILLIAGFPFTVIVSVALHPLLSVYVITEVPEETADTTPRLETEATPVDAETQGFEVAAVPLPVNVEVPPTHKVVVPVIVTAVGLASVTDFVLIFPLFDLA